MEYNSVCNHTGNRQNRTTAKRESDLSITSIITDRIDDTKSCFQLIITITISEKTMHLEQISVVETMLEIPSFGNSPVFLSISGCCYGYCDKFYDWWIKVI